MDWLKTLHVTLAGASFAGFLLRTGGALAAAAWVRARFARTVPHLLDTALFISALALLARLHWLPLQQPWLLAKLGALVGYIIFGVITLRAATNNRVRLLAALAACGCFLYMLGAAITKSPWPFS
ncbi:SirB2 family protein [Microbulbifer discodermiae]|uniref:SirB2 family protein n=1 Tax=Microbulbifer sp. 2201CG32-9 TaxID=3232309 RepID=UPI00345BA6A5